MTKQKLKMIPLWIVQVLLALAFLKAGSSKLMPGSVWAEMFRRWGYPEHFYVAVGVIEVAGAVGLLIPRLAGSAASVLLVVMAGALCTHLRHGERQAVVTAVFIALLALVALVRRPGFLRRGRKAATIAGVMLAVSLASYGQQKTAEQVYKNIQVFQGVPATGLMGAMSFMSASLGVNCTHCHVPNQFEKDDKPAKQAARRMIRMMHAINRENFDGKKEVNCYTCHRGQLQTASIPERGPQPPKAAAANAAEAAPKPQEIRDRYIRALGGQTNMERLSTRMRKGVAEAAGLRIPIEMYEKAPDKLLMIGQFPNGKMQRGYDGAVGWEQNAGQSGVREPTGEEAVQLQNEAEFYQGARLLKGLDGVASKTTEKIGGREAFVIEVAGSGEKLYFDAESGLLVRRLRLVETVLGKLPFQADFEDYREVDGVRLPFTTRFSRPDVSITVRFEEMRHNVAVEEGMFSKPGKAPQ